MISIFVKNHKKLLHENRHIVFVILILIISFTLLVKNTFADATDTVNYDLTLELSESQIADLSNFDTLAKMMTDIFSFDRQMGDNSLNDTGSLLYELIESALLKFDDFTNSTMYRYI